MRRLWGDRPPPPAPKQETSCRAPLGPEAVQVADHGFEPVVDWSRCGHIRIDKAGVGHPCDRPAEEHGPAPEVTAT